MEVNLHIVVRTVVISNGRRTRFLEDLDAIRFRRKLMLFDASKHRTFTFLVVVVTGEI